MCLRAKASGPVISIIFFPNTYTFSSHKSPSHRCSTSHPNPQQKKQKLSNVIARWVGSRAWTRTPVFWLEGQSFFHDILQIWAWTREPQALWCMVWARFIVQLCLTPAVGAWRTPRYSGLLPHMCNGLMAPTCRCAWASRWDDEGSDPAPGKCATFGSSHSCNWHFQAIPIFQFPQ